MSLFVGKTGLRSQYLKSLAAPINATTGVSNAILMGQFRQADRLAYFMNTTAMDIAIYLVHPDIIGTPTDANKLFLLEIPANTILNLEIAEANLELDPGTRIYVSKANATTGVTGTFSIFLWG